MARRIDIEKCIGCGKCEQSCIVGCISNNENGKRIIDKNACVDCGACQLVCPIKCIDNF